MRASRLLLILTTLQAKGRATAQDLAGACEVSLRTIYRDIDALSAAGIPVYAERGAEGGYRLLDGYRTRLNGLSREEAEALFLSGLPDAVSLLGLGAAMATAEVKLLAALPADLRKSADTMRARFYLDAPAWFADLERPTLLQQVAEAIWSQTALHMRYQSGKGKAGHVVEPLGVVLKNAAWYMVARLGKEIWSFRVARILELRTLGEKFTPPADFNLQAYWHASAQRFENSLYTDHARVRLSPRGVKSLGALGRAAVQAFSEADSAPDEKGWREATIPIESVEKAAWEFLRLGPEIEVLAPDKLRSALAASADAMHNLYKHSRA
ncbi:MAG: YafY family protein [Alphaproteobacteria bacterium]